MAKKPRGPDYLEDLITDDKRHDFQLYAKAYKLYDMPYQMKRTTTRIRNIKKYMLTCLFNAPTTISSFYQQEVNADFPQFARQ